MTWPAHLPKGLRAIPNRRLLRLLGFRAPIIVPEPTINVVPWKQGLCFQVVWAGQLVEWETLN
jgi:hypothetical protein